MEMDQTQPLILKEKLEFLDILKQALKIPYKSPQFIIFTLITSLPFLYFSLFFDQFLQKSLIRTLNFLSKSTDANIYGYYSFEDHQFHEPIRSQESLPSTLFQLSVLYLIPYNLLDFLTMILSTDAAALIYIEQENEKPVSLREMICRSLKTRLVGPFFASMYVLFFSSCILIGLIAIVANGYIVSRWHRFGNSYYYWSYYYHGASWSFVQVFIGVVLGIAFVALLVKYLEWRAGWNMALVISVVEEADGAEALDLSGYYGRGSSDRGFWLMVVVFGWEVVFRMLRLLGGGLGWSVVLGGLFGVGNVMKWVVFVVFFVDCKKRIMEKKVDEEIGRENQAVEYSTPPDKQFSILN